MLGEFPSGSGSPTYYIPGMGQDSAGAMGYFNTDGLGSVRQLTDATGTLTYAANFDPYGGILNPNVLSGSTNLGYTGAPSDPSGLVYLNARFYNPSIGSFLTHDSVEGVPTSPESFNGYSYVGSNPSTYADPSGKFLPLLFAGLVLLAGGLIFGGLPAAVEWRTAHDCGCGPSDVQNANPYAYVAGRTAVASGIGLAIAAVPEIALPLALVGAGSSINQAASNWNSSNPWETLQRSEGIFGTVVGLAALPFAANTTSEALNSRLWYLSGTDPLFHPDVVYPQVQGYLWQQLATSALAGVDTSAIAAEVETSTTAELMDPNNVRYGQSSVSLHGNGYTVGGNAIHLRIEPGFDLPPIRGFLKMAYMDEWGERINPNHPEFGPGDPANLENGQIYTLDNRRVLTYRIAGRAIPIQWVGDDVVREWSWEFTTKNKGTDIATVP